MEGNLFHTGMKFTNMLVVFLCLRKCSGGSCMIYGVYKCGVYVCVCSLFVKKTPITPTSLPSAHVAVLLVVCMWVTPGSEAGPLTRKGLHTGDTHIQRVTLMGFTCHLSALCVFLCV